MQEGVGYRVESIASRESGFQGTRGDTPLLLSPPTTLFSFNTNRDVDRR